MKVYFAFPFLFYHKVSCVQFTFVFILTTRLFVVIHFNTLVIHALIHQIKNIQSTFIPVIGMLTTNIKHNSYFFKCNINKRVAPIADLNIKTELHFYKINLGTKSQLIYKCHITRKKTISSYK